MVIRGICPSVKGKFPKKIDCGGKFPYSNFMTEESLSPTAKWLRRRDAWIRQLVSSGFVSRNGKLIGVYVAMRLSAKKPYTYPAMKTMGKALGVSTRQIARALKELEEEGYIRVRRVPGKVSHYSLDL